MANDDAIPTSRLSRLTKLGAAGARAQLSRAWIGLSTLGRSEQHKAATEAAHHRAMAEQLLSVLGQMKGVVTKLGQLASFVDTGMIPEEHADIYRDVLAALRSHASPMSYARVAEVIEADHGTRPELLFEAFEELPMAAASIGQVHRARLRDGRRVVVKVQYPRVDESITSDLENAQALAMFLPLLVPGMDGPALFVEIERALREELDYLAEARHQQRFYELYQGHPFVRIPAPVLELCGPHSLVSEEVSGPGFDELRSRPQAERDRAGEILYRFAFGTLFRAGFFNADTHPGNYAFSDDGRVVFYDFGAVKSVPEQVLIELKNMTAALMYGDIGGLYEDCCITGFIRNPKRVDPQRLYDYLEMSAGQLISAKGRVKVTRAWVREVVVATSDPRQGWFDLLRHLNVHPDSLLIGRMQLGVMAVLAQLEASGPWGDIAREWVLGAAPCTSLGLRDAAFFKARVEQDPRARSTTS